MRTAGSSRLVTEQAIRDAAIDTISRHGFRSASLRMIAKEVGIQAGSLYNYITSKEEFLTALIQSTLGDMLQTLASRIDGVKEPRICFLEFVWLHLELHTDEERRKEIIIGNLELRNLSPEYYQRVTAMRDAYSNRLTEILTEGLAKGQVDVEDARTASFALIAMLTGVSYWFRSNGRLSRVSVMKEHTVLALRLAKVSVTAKSLSAFFAKAIARMDALQAPAPG